MKSHWTRLIFILLALSLFGCATTQLEKILSQNKGAISYLSAGRLEVTLRSHSIYDEPFRFSLNKAMQKRYVCSSSKSAFKELAFVINDVHFEDKGASLLTGGATGGNSLHGMLILNKGGMIHQIRVDEEFNTGGGYTIIQDWEDRMIKAVLLDIDKALIAIGAK